MRSLLLATTTMAMLALAAAPTFAQDNNRAPNLDDVEIHMKKQVTQEARVEPNGECYIYVVVSWYDVSTTPPTLIQSTPTKTRKKCPEAVPATPANVPSTPQPMIDPPLPPDYNWDWMHNDFSNGSVILHYPDGHTVLIHHDGTKTDVPPGSTTDDPYWKSHPGEFEKVKKVMEEQRKQAEEDKKRNAAEQKRIDDYRNTHPDGTNRTRKEGEEPGKAKEESNKHSMQTPSDTRSKTNGADTEHSPTRQSSRASETGGVRKSSESPTHRTAGLERQTTFSKMRPTHVAGGQTNGLGNASRMGGLGGMHAMGRSGGFGRMGSLGGMHAMGRSGGFGRMGGIGHFGHL